MKPELEAYVNRAADPSLIPGIYNSCHQWRERCPFTARCLTVRDRQAMERAHPERGVLDHVHDSFHKTFELLEAWCEKEGVDVDALKREAHSPEADAEEKRLDDQVGAEPLMKMAQTYTNSAFTIVKSLESVAPVHSLEPAVDDAIEIVGWYSGVVTLKIHRALDGAARLDEDIYPDPIQSDWNGSAKVARLAVRESRSAWLRIFEAGEAPVDSPIRGMVVLLNKIEAAIDGRFPDAMRFVRPGFDEPDVAAGALTKRACFEPRPAQGG